MRRGGKIERWHIILSITIALLIFLPMLWLEIRIYDINYDWISDRKCFALMGEFMPLGALHEWGMQREFLKDIERKRRYDIISP